MKIEVDGFGECEGLVRHFLPGVVFKPILASANDTADQASPSKARGNVDSSRDTDSTGSSDDTRSAQSATRLLIVEDHPDTRNALIKMLGWNGFVVRGASTITDALTAVSEEPFDLIISDIGLPDGSGLDFMRHVGENLGLRGIAFSGFGTDDDIRAGKEAGFLHYFVKPINLAALINCIRELTAD